MNRKKDTLEFSIRVNKNKLVDNLIVFGFIGFFVALGIGIGWLIWAPGGKSFRQNAGSTVNGWFGKKTNKPEPAVAPEETKAPLPEPKEPVETRPTHPTHPENDPGPKQPDPKKDEDDEEKTVPKLF